MNDKADAGQRTRRWVIAFAAAFVVSGLVCWLNAPHFWQPPTITEDAVSTVSDSVSLPPPVPTPFPVAGRDAPTQETGAAAHEVPRGDSTPEPLSPAKASPENDPQHLLEVASLLLNKNEFVNQLVESQVLVEVPAPVTVDRPVAERAYWTIVHVLAGQMYVYRPEALKADPRAEHAMADKIRTDMLQSLMPDLPSLIRDKRVEMSIVNKGGAEKEQGNIAASFAGVQVDEKGTRMRLSMQRGPWTIKMMVPKEAVSSDLWSAWLAARNARNGR